MTATILVTDAEQRSSLAVVRSLGRAGFNVHVCSSRPRALAAASRYCSSHTPVPDALAHPDRFAEVLAATAKAKSADVLLPITDASVLAVLSNAGAFAARIPLPNLNTYRASADKAAMVELARSIGFDVPSQSLLIAPQDVIDAGRLGFPVVLKPHCSVSEGRKHPVRYAGDPADLRKALAALPASAFPVLVQERIVGPGIGLFLLLWDGQLKAAFAHRRLLEKPPSGGVSVRSESIVPPPGLLDRAERLLRSLDWRGVAMVECKMDRRNGRICLMEVNGRFWGSLQLAIDAGVDFPLMLVRLALGLPVAQATAWRPGVRLRWSLGELDHLLTRLRHSRASLALPHDVPALGSVLAGFLMAPFTGLRGEVLRWSDPAPAVREAIDWIWRH